MTMIDRGREQDIAQQIEATLEDDGGTTVEVLAGLMKAARGIINQAPIPAQQTLIDECTDLLYPEAEGEEEALF